MHLIVFVVMRGREDAHQADTKKLETEQRKGVCPGVLHPQNDKKTME